MSMVKVIPPSSYDWGEEAAKMIKIASTGLRGNDLSMLIKRAGHEFADMVKRLKFSDGEVPIHLLAMGATESVGPNRNGDGWKTATLRAFHPTFVKHAKFYRSHKNKDPQKSYGVVKLSTFNENARRVELIVALNGNKKAAEQNKGLVADRELDKLEKNAEIAVSMAAKVSFDLCSSCGHKAASRDDYCESKEEGGHCKHGGLRNAIGTVYEDGQHLHADNPHSKFFDISHVFRPADRTAYVFGKVASITGTVSGAELAEVLGVSAPISVTDGECSPSMLNQLRMVEKLSSYENNLTPSVLDHISEYTAPIDFDPVTNQQLPLILRALANEKIALSFPDWLKLITGASYEKCAETAISLASYLSNVYSELRDDPNLDTLIEHNPCKSAISTTERLAEWASKQASDRALDRFNIQRKIWQASISDQPKVKDWFLKVASTFDSQAAKQLAKQYGVYQLGLLQDLSHHDDFDLTCELVVRQNRV